MIANYSGNVQAKTKWSAIFKELKNKIKHKAIASQKISFKTENKIKMF